LGVDAQLNDALEARARATCVASQATVAAALDDLARQITARLQDKNPVLLAVMNGGVFAATALASRLDWPYEFDYVHLSRYGDALVGQAIEWHVRPRAALVDRHVLIIDDVLDEGRTLEQLITELGAIGPASIHTAVLVEKTVPRELDRPRVDFVGLRLDDRYLFGCGMDYRGYWRGLPALYAVPLA